MSERSFKLSCSPAGNSLLAAPQAAVALDSMKLGCACSADLQEGADKLQRNFDQAADQAASRAESLVDKVSQGRSRQSAAWQT